MTAITIDRYARGQLAYISGKTRNAHGYNFHALVAIAAWGAGYSDAAKSAQHINPTRAAMARVDAAQAFMGGA